MGPQPIHRIQLLGQVLITKQRMNLLMAGRTDVRRWPRILLFSPCLLARYQVMFCQLWAVTLAKFTLGHRREVTESFSMVVLPRLLR